MVYGLSLYFLLLRKRSKQGGYQLPYVKRETSAGWTQENMGAIAGPQPHLLRGAEMNESPSVMSLVTMANDSSNRGTPSSAEAESTASTPPRSDAPSKAAEVHHTPAGEIIVL